MGYALLNEIIEQEGSDFQRLNNRWRPTDLLQSQQVRLLLRDLEAKFNLLSQAEGEFATLDRRDIYITIIRRMRLWLRQARFSWKSDHLQFIQAIASFYRDYGRILRLLRIDAQRGRLTEGPH